MSLTYDLLNIHIHVDDPDFALGEGLIPRVLAQTNIVGQFRILAQWAGLKLTVAQEIMNQMMSNSDRVAELTRLSFLPEASQRRYIQDYQYRLKLLKENGSLW